MAVDWQPMETVPRDGRYVGLRIHGVPMTARFRPEISSWDCPFGTLHVGNEEQPDPYYVTGWFPVPQPLEDN